MTPQQIATATQKSIQGVPGCKIAQTLGVHESTISRTLNNPEIKAKIEAAASRIVNEGVETAVDTVLRLSKRGKETEDKDWAKIGLDASKTILAIPGIHGQAPSTVINALIQVNQAPEQLRELEGITAFLHDRWGMDKLIGVQVPHTQPADAQVIDVDPVSEVDT
jgi:hypothetical protein